MGKFVNFCASASAPANCPGRNLDGLLLNVLYTGVSDSAYRTARKTIEYVNPNYFILDSSGFQYFIGEQEGKEITFNPNEPLQFDKKVNNSPYHVVKVAKQISDLTSRMTRRDILIALDYPLQEITNVQAQEIEFRKKFDINVEFAIETARLKKESGLDCRLFLPVQCFTLSQFDDFMERLRDVFFDGVCTPLRNYTMRETADFIIRFHQKGFRQVHLLAVGNFPFMAFSAYLARHHFNWFSVDSSTWRHNSFANKYLNPATLRWIPTDQLLSFKSDIKCKCPYCQYYQLSDIKNLPKTDRQYFLALHNYWNTENACKVFYDNSSTLITLARYLRMTSMKDKKIEEIIDCLSWIDLHLNKQKY
ncbi:hypothetical protein ACFL7D_07790 [candidate division KSB1 bacterium]